MRKLCRLSNLSQGSPLLAMTSAVALVFGTVACGGGSSSHKATSAPSTDTLAVANNNSTSSNPPSVPGQLNGSVVDGWIAGAFIQCITGNKKVNIVNIKNNQSITSAEGQFAYDAALQCDQIEASSSNTGSTLDTLTGQDPQMTLLGPAPTEAFPSHISPLTTIIALTPANQQSELMQILFGDRSKKLTDVSRIHPFGKTDGADQVMVAQVAKLNTVVSQTYLALVRMYTSITAKKLDTEQATAFMGSLAAAMVTHGASLLENAVSATSMTNIMNLATNALSPTVTTPDVKKQMLALVPIAIKTVTQTNADLLTILENTIQAKKDLALLLDPLHGDYKPDFKNRIHAAVTDASISNAQKIVQTSGVIDPVAAMNALAQLSPSKPSDSGSPPSTPSDINTALGTLCDTTCQNQVNKILTIKGLACANNQITIGTLRSQTVSYESNGQLRNTVTNVDNKDLVISCALRGYTNADGTGTLEEKKIYESKLFLYFFDVTHGRMINATLLPVQVTLTGNSPPNVIPSAVDISIPAGAILSFTAKTNSLILNALLSNVAQDANLVVSSNQGSLQVDANKLIDLIRNKYGANNIPYLIEPASTYQFELGLGDIDLGFVGTSSLNNLLPSGTHVSGHAIQGRFVTN
ncbi:MAG: hypothetical protein H7839_02945 [Magnetococcus sp. YQC-5]